MKDGVTMVNVPSTDQNSDEFKLREVDLLAEICPPHAFADDASAASDGEPCVRSWLAPDGNAPRAARWLVSHALSGWGLDGHILENAQLTVSELVTNAVVHGGTALSLHVHRLADGVRIEVCDGGEGVPTRQRVAATAGSGRGLAIIDALATRWGVSRSAHDKTVWAELAAA
jgi:anti-sigma regulatory factor (Ser/Thr protein kinase)